MLDVLYLLARLCVWLVVVPFVFSIYLLTLSLELLVQGILAVGRVLTRD